MHYVPRGNPAGTETRSTAKATVMLAIACRCSCCLPGRQGSHCITVDSPLLRFRSCKRFMAAVCTELVGLLAAVPVGSFSARIGNKRAVLIGLLALAVARASGGASPNIGWLLLSRTVEGIGFVLIVVAAPSLIAEVTNPTDIKFALAGLSAYMPGAWHSYHFLLPYC